MSSYQKRRESLLEWTDDNQIDLFVVSSEVNLRYLTGFTGQGIGIINPDETVVVTDRRYEIEADQEIPGCRVIFAEQGYLRVLTDWLDNLDNCRVGFESRHLSFAEHQKLGEKVSGVELIPTEQVIEKQRMVKDDGEIAAIRQAAHVVDQAVQKVLSELEVGITEQQLSLRLREEILQAGGEDVSFAPVVAFAEHSAAAHATPSARKLSAGDIVLVDAGAKTDEYCSDITRTVVMGDPGEKFIEVYSTVREAQQKAMAAITPGVKAAEVDRVAREVIDASSYRGKFGHSLGHGVGLDVHELPRLGKKSEDLLAVGQVVTNEPGIYLPGWGGVRLEELVLVTEQGAEPLTTAAYLEL